LLLKYEENIAWRVAGLELSDEWVSKKVVLRVFFVCVQGIVKDKLEVERRSGDSSLSVRHEDGGRFFVLRGR